MKKIFLIIMMVSMSNIWANEADAELLSAQIAYQKALKAYGYEQDLLNNIQSDLEIEKKKLYEINNRIQNLEQKLTVTKDSKVQADQQLKRAGERLDNAWKRAKPASQ